MLNHTELMDLEEMNDPHYDYPWGSNFDGASTEQDEIILHNQNEQYLYDCETMENEEEIIINNCFCRISCMDEVN